MTTTPDPQIVREIARRCLDSDIRRLMPNWFAQSAGPVIQAEGAASTVEAFTAWHEAVVKQISTAQITVSWPDERDAGGPDDSFAMIAEDMPAGPPRAIAEYWNGYAMTINEGCPSPEWASIAHVTAVILSAMNAEQDERDGDVRAVAALLDEYRGGGTIAECKREFNALGARFADRIAALDARDARIEAEQ